MEAREEHEVREVGGRPWISQPTAAAAGDLDHVRLESPVQQQDLANLRRVSVHGAQDLRFVSELILELVENFENRQNADVLQQPREQCAFGRHARALAGKHSG